MLWSGTFSTFRLWWIYTGAISEYLAVCVCLCVMHICSLCYSRTHIYFIKFHIISYLVIPFHKLMFIGFWSISRNIWRVFTMCEKAICQRVWDRSAPNLICNKDAYKILCWCNFVYNHLNGDLLVLCFFISKGIDDVIWEIRYH